MVTFDLFRGNFTGGGHSIERLYGCTEQPLIEQEMLAYRLFKPIKARVETVYRISQLGVGREQGQNSHMWAHEHTS